MATKIYVGGISFDTTEEGLRTAFSAFGGVDTVSVVTDRATGRSRGFAFVEMGDDGEAKAAIDALDGTELDGRTIRVNVSKPQERRGGHGGHGGRGGRRY